MVIREKEYVGLKEKKCKITCIPITQKYHC